MRTARMHGSDLFFICPPAIDIRQSLKIFDGVTDQVPLMRGTIHVRSLTAHAHCAHAPKRSHYYLSASHRYQSIFANLCFSHRSIAYDVQGYSFYISDRACMKVILSLSVHQP
jgi:hypothetical protein